MTRPTLARTISGSCLALRVRMVERAVTAIYSAHLKPHNITAQQITLLVAIANNPGCRAVDLASMLFFDRSTLSRNLSRMDQVGWLIFMPGTKRSQHLSLSDDGHAMLEGVFDDWQTAQREAEALLGEHATAVYGLASDLTEGRLSPTF